ncbi:unnamed protein product [Moneuplotes crassus]|uniref:Uncharacterized protein n=1 Tax=Euplotes crassus TaxID=5936 RepID=A0AAD1XZ93_EUPCR|nr:unnamed protein product [Moneuplotes crassus]
MLRKPGHSQAVAYLICNLPKSECIRVRYQGLGNSILLKKKRKIICNSIHKNNTSIILVKIKRAWSRGGTSIYIQDQNLGLPKET